MKKLKKVKIKLAKKPKFQLGAWNMKAPHVPREFFDGKIGVSTMEKMPCVYADGYFINVDFPASIMPQYWQAHNWSTPYPLNSCRCSFEVREVKQVREKNA